MENNFITDIIEADIAAGKLTPDEVTTRFPPENNGILHLGHAASICLNFGIAARFGGKCNLRIDDTNPGAETAEYAKAIEEDVRWLGFEWGKTKYTSDYFDLLCGMAESLIKIGLAYVDDSTSEEIAAMKGTTTEPGALSPYRDRTPEENLGLFRAMKLGWSEDGQHVLRAKIDMASPNMHMRDPIIYRVKKEGHHRTGKSWNIYPMYDFAHGQSDAIEGVTHSLCTMEFESHRPLYDWFIEKLGLFPSRQYEFSRRNLEGTVTSKRKLLKLIEDGHVTGWDDPRMPTIRGLRMRGYTPASIRKFCDVSGVSRHENTASIALLEHCIREELNKTATRRMAVVDPVLLVIDNYDAGRLESFPTDNNPEDPSTGMRPIAFSRNLWIEREDFMEAPAKDFFRLSPGSHVRLKSAFIVRCDSFKKDDSGKVTEIYCTYYPDSYRADIDGVKVRSTIHYVSASHARPATFRLYDRLFLDGPDKLGMQEPEDFTDLLNPASLVTKTGYVESIVAEEEECAYQFMRVGYFFRDANAKVLTFNRTVTLKDGWARQANRKSK